MTRPPPSPRIHFILAREAPVAVVFRRGPSKQVAVLKWDLRTDEVTLGQWLKGRIYPMRSDLSPDGRHMIYFAGDARWEGSMGGAWTAVSEVPYLTALQVYRWGWHWNGGGLFLDKLRYWVNVEPGWPVELTGGVQTRLRRSDEVPAEVSPAPGDDPVIYLPRLRRDGWRETSRSMGKDEREIVLEKPVRKNWTLEKSFRERLSADAAGERYSEAHRLRGPEGAVDLPKLAAADVLKDEVLFARDGALWRQRVHAKGPEDPKLVADLSGMNFETREAPYAGVRKVRNG